MFTGLPLLLVWPVREKLSYQIVLLCLTTQIRFPIGGEHVTCHGSKPTNSPGKKRLKLSTRTWSGRANLYASCVKQIIFTQSWQLNGFKQGLKKKLKSFYATKARNLLTWPPTLTDFCKGQNLDESFQESTKSRKLTSVYCSILSWEV